MTQTIEAPAQAGNGNGNGLATVQRAFQPLAPVGSASGLKSLLQSQSKGIAETLPRHITPERLIKTMLVAANRIPKLLDCTQASILETINRAAELGLDLSGTTGEAYPVPFGNVCQLIIGYRGFAKLARQSGEIKRIDADVVCENDTFVFRKGSDARCEFTPNLKGERGEPVGAYAFVQFKDGGEQFDFMPTEDIEKVRAKAQSRNSPAWKDHWGEMAKKTVFRRVAKWLPLSTEKFVAALEHDDADNAMADVIEAQTERGAAALTRRLTQKPVSEGQTFSPDPEALAEAQAAQDSGESRETAAEPDVSGAQAEAPAPSFLTWDEFCESMLNAAMERKMPEKELYSWIGAKVLKLGAKGKEKTIGLDVLKGWYQEFVGQ